MPDWRAATTRPWAISGGQLGDLRPKQRVLVPRQNTYRVYRAGPTTIRPYVGLFALRIVVVVAATAAVTPVSARTEATAEIRAALPRSQAARRPTACSVLFRLLLWGRSAPAPQLRP